MSSMPAETLQEALPTISQQLGQFTSGLRLDAIPEAVRIRAKHLMLDSLGIALASTTFDFADATAAGIEALGGAGDSSVIGKSGRLPLRDAVLLNGILVHGLDYDDTHVPGVIHATASAFPTALGVAERHQNSGRDLLSAYIVGVEAGARIAAAAKGGFHKVGFHPTGLVGTFGAALVAGRLLGLDSEHLAMAQGIALSMAGASMEFLEDGAWTKRMHPGWAGVSGITAAYLAQHEFPGPARAYEGRFGLFNTHLDPRDPPPALASIVEGLGQTWEIERVAVKPFPACHFVHGCADAALALVQEHALKANEVQRITALVPKETIPTICEPRANKLRPVSDYDAKFSVQYTIAASICRGRFGLAELEDDALHDDEILALAERVDHEPDPKSPFPAAYSGELVVETKDGRILRHREHINRGAEERPLSNGEIAEKFLDNAVRAVSAGSADEMRRAILSMEQFDDARELTEVLRSA